MFDDPVATLLADLRERVPLVPASGRVPSPRPARFVRVQLVGTQAITPAHRIARMLVECWDETDPKADRLGALIESLLPDSGTPWNRILPAPDCWVAGPVPLPDPESGSPRAVMTVSMIQRSR